MTMFVVQFVGGPLDGERVAMRGDAEVPPDEIPFGFIKGSDVERMAAAAEAHAALGEPLPAGLEPPIEHLGSYWLTRRAEVNRYAWREDSTSGSR